MKTFIQTLFLMLIIVLGTSQEAQAMNTSEKITTDRKAGKSFTRKISFEGKTRRYKVHIPGGFRQGESLPLVIVLHGAASNAFNISIVTQMSKRADRERFLVVYPTGTGNAIGLMKTWNAGIRGGPAYKRNVDDVEFIKRLMEKMVSEYAVDEKRIYVAGMSNGGMMAYRLAAELSDRIAAIGVVESTMFGPKPKIGFPVSVIAFHGEKDKVFPIDGGKGKWFIYNFESPSVQSTLNYWIERNGCSNKPEIESSNGLTKYKYSGGINNTEIVLFKLKKWGHFWPGGRGVRLFHRAGNVVSATDEMCEFFFAHPKK